MTGDDKTLVRDLTNPAERAEFVARLRHLVALGVDGFKGDRGDEVNLEPNTLVGGPGVIEQNAYPLLYDRAAARAIAGTRGSRFGSLFRASAPGSSSALPGFVGPDAPQSYTGLQGEIRAAQTAGIAGLPVWGSDVGGYAGGKLTAGLFVRWAQFAALTPIFEVGGAGPNATFWQLGSGAVNGLRAAATLHYELIPYLYSLALSASRTGIPVVRPLGLTWPADANAWANDLELTVGDALLAAPAVSDAPTSTVYLPHGRWIDLFSGIAQNGGRTIARSNGADDFPLPIPLIRQQANWKFDTAAGRLEDLYRRIGRNELDAIQTSLAYVDAQNEYAEKDRTGAGPGVYARRIISSAGKKDGLYWPAPDGDASPLGELIAQASEEGYKAGAGRTPYHGYYYRILTRQGPNAPGGVLDYVVKGKMIGGFGLLAYPAEYGNSGVMTFVVNHSGTVYQKDLGNSTASLAGRMTWFDPDQTWKKVDAPRP